MMSSWCTISSKHFSFHRKCPTSWNKVSLCSSKKLFTEEWVLYFGMLCLFFIQLVALIVKSFNQCVVKSSFWSQTGHRTHQQDLIWSIPLEVSPLQPMFPNPNGQRETIMNINNWPAFNYPQWCEMRFPSGVFLLSKHHQCSGKSLRIVCSK